MAIVLNGTTGITTPGLDASGTNKFATTIGVGNATPSASGAGITFPATQSASSDANTLDDYEEGTFTPTWNGGSLTVNSCLYRKIGSLVHAMYDVQLGSSASGTSATITLPIAANPSAFYTGIFNFNSVSASQTVNLDSVAVYFRAAQNAAVVPSSSISSARLIFSVTYFA